MTSVFHGVQCFTQGLRLAYAKPLRRYALLPALLSLIIVGTGLVVAFSYVTDLSNYLVNSLPGWLSFLSWVLEPLLYLLGTLVGAWMFGFCAAILGAPFFGELSKAVDAAGDDQFDQRAWWQLIGPTMMRELRKLRYHLPRLVLLLVASIVPLLNTLSPFLWVVFGAWMMAVQFCDFPHENRGTGFDQTLQLLGQHRAPALGFGVCVTLAMSIPLLNFVFLPAAVVGGTLLWQSLHTQQATPAS